MRMSFVAGGESGLAVRHFYPERASCRDPYHHIVTPLSRTIVIACAALLALPTLGFVQSAAPTLAIVNARVFTGVAAAPWAEALTVVRERIGTVGTTAAVRALAGSSTRVVDAGGRLVIPGINDAHVHVGTVPPGTNLEGPPAVEHDPSLDEILTRLKAAVASAPSGGLRELGGRVLDDPKETRSTVEAPPPRPPPPLGPVTERG